MRKALENMYSIENESNGIFAKVKVIKNTKVSNGLRHFVGLAEFCLCVADIFAIFLTLLRIINWCELIRWKTRDAFGITHAQRRGYAYKLLV